MQGQHHYQHKLIHEFDIEALIPAHHLLRRVDQEVSFEFIRQLTAPYYCSHNGRPSIDPEVFFRMVLVGYLYNITSDRQLCEEVQYNLAYRWFCKLNLEDKIPHHSSFTTIRDRFGLLVFQRFFEEILNQCRQYGLVKAARIMTDGTLIAANAALSSLVPKMPESPHQEKVAFTPAEFSSSKARPLSNEAYISRTDPDATLAKKKQGAGGLKYKVHLSIDADSRVILATKVTTGAMHESQPYLAQLNQIQETLNCFIQTAIADRAFGSGEILQALIHAHITPIIPLFNRRSGGFVLTEKEGFIYEEAHDRYRCPTGHYLIPYSTSSETVKYHSQGKICQSCPQQEICPTKRFAHAHVRFTCRNKHQSLFERMSEQMKTDSFKTQQTERFWKMEGIISEAKNRQGLARAKYRGLTKVQIQAYLSASAQNIKRLVLFFILYWLNYWYYRANRTVSQFDLMIYFYTKF